MALSRNGICFIPLAIILPPIFGLAGVEVCQALADLLALIIALPISISLLKHFYRLQKGMEQEAAAQPEQPCGDNLIGSA